MESIGHSAQVLDFGQELGPALVRRRRAIDVGKWQGVAIQVGDARTRPLVDPEYGEQKSGDTEQRAQHG
jgi:hypothetical protein